MAYVNSAVVINETSGQNTGTGASFTVVGGADHLLIAAISGFTDGGSDPIGASSVEFEGVAMTKLGTSTRSGRNWTEIWVLVNPPAGAGVLEIVYVSDQDAQVVFLEERDGLDTGGMVAQFVDAGAGTNDGSRAVSITTNNPNAPVIGVLAASSDEPAPITVTGGGTIRHQATTGTANFSDVTGALAYEVVTSAGADGFTFVLDANADNCACAIELIPASGGGTPLEVTPATGSAAASGHDPAVLAAASMATGAGSASGVGATPTIGAGVSIDVGAGSASAVGQAPTVEVGATITVTPGTGSAAAGGAAPGIAAGAVCAAGAGQASADGSTASVAAKVTTAPGAGTAEATGRSASFAAGVQIAPGAGSASATGHAPTVVVGATVTITPGAGSASANGAAPAVAANANTAPGTGTAGAAGNAPVVNAKASIDPEVGSASASGNAAGVAAGLIVVLAAGEATATGLQPTVQVVATPFEPPPADRVARRAARNRIASRPARSRVA